MVEDGGRRRRRSSSTAVVEVSVFLPKYHQVYRVGDVSRRKLGIQWYERSFVALLLRNFLAAAAAGGIDLFSNGNRDENLQYVLLRNVGPCQRAHLRIVKWSETNV